MAKTPSMGRKKIKITKIENKNHLQVTFSKRRSGLFKKASERSTLCGVDVAIIIFSPAGKVMSFGNPNVDSTVNKFLAGNSTHNYASFHFHEARSSTSLMELNFQLNQILSEVELEKRKGESIDEIRKVGAENRWWEAPLDKLGLNELELLRTCMEQLKQNVGNRANKLLLEGFVNSSPHFLVNGNNGGGSIDQFGNTLPNHMISCFGYGNGLF